jgi:signal transduction histidine kinase
MSGRLGFGASGRGLTEHDIEFLDRILQDLFGMGLKLEYCLSVLDDAPAQAKTGMEDVVTDLDQLVEPIRAEIRRLGGSRNLAEEISC